MQKPTKGQSTAMKVDRKLMAGLAAMAATAAMWGAQAQAQTPKKGGVLNIAVVAEPPNYDCHANSTFGVSHPVSPHYSTLLKYTGGFKSVKIEGDLAESWTVAPDGLTYTFKLVKGVKFHDGSPFTSADVKATYERIAKPPAGVISVRQPLYEDIATIETPDDHTVAFKLKSVNASMLDGLASPWNCIYSAAKLKENPKFPETNILGTGPFRFVEHVKGQSWEAKRFDGYFRNGRPYLDGYKMFFVKSAGLATGLIGGQFDIELRGISPVERDQIMEKKKDDMVAQEGPWSCSNMIAFNSRKKPFDDIRVRQALSLAIDRWGGAPAVAKISLLKHVGGFSRPGSQFSLSDAELEKLPGYGRDIAKSREEAKKLLKEAGVENLKVTFLNRAVGQPYTTAGIYLADQWKRIGVETEVKQLETKLFFDALAKQEFDISIDFICDHADDPSLQYTHFLSTAKNSPASYSKNSDKKIDELFDKQKVTLDPAARKKATAEFETYAITQSHNAMLFWWQRIVVHHKRLKGWDLTASHYTGNDLLDVWLDQ
jgi:peptide/nickel transport system substrate-binding protein